MSNKMLKDREGILKKYLVRPFSTRITKVIVDTKITPNQITLLYILLSLLSSYFFLQGSYRELIIGAVILKIAYIFDGVNGELARIRKITSEFGSWFDDFGDRIRESVTFISLAIGLYKVSNDVNVLYLGLLAVANVLLVAFAKSPTLSKNVSTKPEFNIGKNFFGFTDTTVYVTIISALLNQVYILLWVYSTVGALVWMKKLISIYRE